MVIHADALLRVDAFAADHVPSVVLRLGEPPASKVLAEWIAAASPVEVHVSDRPAVSDPGHRLAARVIADPSVMCRRLAAALTGARGTPWAARWRHAEATARAALAPLLAADPATEPAVAAALVAGLPTGATLVVLVVDAGACARVVRPGT